VTIFLRLPRFFGTFASTEADPVAGLTVVAVVVVVVVDVVATALLLFVFSCADVDEDDVTTWVSFVEGGNAVVIRRVLDFLVVFGFVLLGLGMFILMDCIDEM